jgi:hypothetical protein
VGLSQETTPVQHAFVVFKPVTPRGKHACLLQNQQTHTHKHLMPKVHPNHPGALFMDPLAFAQSRNAHTQGPKATWTEAQKLLKQVIPTTWPRLTLNPTTWPRFVNAHCWHRARYNSRQTEPAR